MNCRFISETFQSFFVGLKESIPISVKRPWQRKASDFNSVTVSLPKFYEIIGDVIMCGLNKQVIHVKKKWKMLVKNVINLLCK